jgi:hypothetical protein
MKIMLNCLEKTEYFIETGLYLGYTSYFVAKNFSNIKCYSCENNENFLGNKYYLGKFCSNLNRNCEN